MIRFDHIAIGAATLAQGGDWLKAATGVTPPKGGQHPSMATHNLLSALGPDTFLEVIAIDPSARAPDHPRWFDLNNPAVQADFPRLHAWLLRTDDIQGCIKTAADLGIDLGRPLPLARGDLRWRFTVRDDGAIPLAGAAPLILQWDALPAHPAKSMTDQGLRLDHLEIQTPQAEMLTSLLTALNLDTLPVIKPGTQTRLTAHMVTPQGQSVTLS